MPNNNERQSPHFAFQTYAWSLGTTSFRMVNFHRNIEEQIKILNEFWSIPQNHDLAWDSHAQKLYYDFSYEKGFITGQIVSNNDKAKTAREKTSGLVDMGLLNPNRRLTSVGEHLLLIAQSGDFSPNNEFGIPADSYIYLKQMIKSSNKIKDIYVRPFYVVGRLIQACDNYLTKDEFTYLAPLCISEDITNEMILNIRALRNDEINIEQIICDTVLNRYNYPAALDYFLHFGKEIEDFKIVGMNRKSPDYDKVYAPLYHALYNVFVSRNEEAIDELIRACKKLNGKIGVSWRSLLYNNPRTIREIDDLKYNEFFEIQNEEQFANAFFKYMHLFKIKANLDDYQDLNKRYLNITDAFLFNDGKVTFTPIFEYYFRTDASNAFNEAFKESSYLTEDCPINQISPCLVYNIEEVINIFNEQENQHIENQEEMYDYLEQGRYNQFKELIDTRFPNQTIISVLESCELRNNDEGLINLFGDDADVPTIFEYIVGVAWYRLSDYQGKILDYMNLSLNANLLPRTHAGGGESDIVYKYPATENYPRHTLLIECSLMEGTTQRRGEMEPVSRHLANYMIDEDREAYCTFISNNLHASVISDFRGRKITPFYRNNDEHVDSMQIIPLNTSDLRKILDKNLTYTDLYNIFNTAYVNTSIASPPQWYNDCIKSVIEIMP